jgi:hypothetical protein
VYLWTACAGGRYLRTAGVQVIAFLRRFTLTTSDPIMSTAQLARIKAVEDSIKAFAEGAHTEATEHAVALDLLRTEFAAIDDEVRSILGKDHVGGVVGVRALALLAARSMAKKAPSARRVTR